MRLWLLLTVLPLFALAQDDAWDDSSWDEGWDDEEQEQAWSGYVEAGVGRRFDNDPLIDTSSTLQELRVRAETEWQGDRYTIGLRADAGYDGVIEDWFIDVRDLSVAFTVGEQTDVAIGRQVQTWGTGDLLFLNDLFPKDFVSFFSGRDAEYLKAPGNAIRITRFSDSINVDFVWTPVFEPDLYLTGERFSFFSPVAGGNIAPEPPLSAVEPDKSFSNGEFALRFFRTVEGREFALYAYRGFFKQPTAQTEDLRPTFAPMQSFGGSFRRPLGPGLFNAEFSYYDSRDDRGGTNPLIPNDQFRALVGYEWEARSNFTVGLQYYMEWTLDHDKLLANSQFPDLEVAEFRQLLTNRLTYRAGMGRFNWSLFTFYSPTDDDFHIRPRLTYRHSDRWSMSLGGNLFGGSESHTFFRQLQDASNAYLRLRFHY